MIIKESVFAQAGAQDSGRTDADFRTGMVPNTVAMAEDVNTYGNWSDRDLKVVCDEIVNALQAYEITPNDSYVPGSSDQLKTLLQTKIKGANGLTGIDFDSYTTAPTQSADGASISFPEMAVIFNTKVYYGDTASTQQRVVIPEQTLSASSGWGTGVRYIYATTNGGLGVQEEPVKGADGASKCFLGSVFVINGVLQAGSWKFQPWLQATSLERRESPTASRKGGFITPKSGKTIQMGAVEILDEGINFGASPSEPSIMRIAAQSPFSYKYLYPGYNPSAAAVTDLDTTHLYNMSDGTWDDISAFNGKFICLVPCVTPAGQTLMIPAMSLKTGDTYSSIFETVEDAKAAVFGLQYELRAKDASGEWSKGSVASRAIYLGQTIIARIGLTDTTDVTQFATVGIIPQALAGFTDASGQTGGGAGAYIPMGEVLWPSATSVTLNNNMANIVQGRTDVPVNIGFPSPTQDIINQMSVKYTHYDWSKGLTFPSTVRWWGSAPSLVVGQTYNIIFEYCEGKWTGGYLTAAV